MAAADARLDLSLPSGKHEALVYVWYERACVHMVDDANDDEERKEEEKGA